MEKSKPLQEVLADLKIYESSPCNIATRTKAWSPPHTILKLLAIHSWKLENVNWAVSEQKGGATWLYWTMLGCTGQYGAELCCTELYLAVLGCTKCKRVIRVVGVIRVIKVFWMIQVFQVVRVVNVICIQKIFGFHGLNNQINQKVEMSRPWRTEDGKWKIEQYLVDQKPWKQFPDTRSAG